MKAGVVAPPRRFTLPRGVRTIELRRHRAKARFTRTLRARVLKAWDDLRDAYMRETGLDTYLEAKSRKKKPHRSDVARATRAIETLDGGSLAEAISSVTLDAYRAAAADALAEAQARLDGFDHSAIVGDFNVRQDRALRALQAYALQFSDDVIDREKDAIKATIAEAIDQGSTTEELARALRDHFEDVHITADDGSITRFIPSDAWAETVARTESSRAYNGGVSDLYRSAGVEQVQFLTSEDERVCPQCEPMDGKVYPIDDEDDAPPIHAACRCIDVIADESLVGGDRAELDA